MLIRVCAWAFEPGVTSARNTIFAVALVLWSGRHS